MPIRGLIEIPPCLAPERLADLVGAAHGACRGGGVVLMLCNAGLDGGLDGGLIERAREADFVIADSERLSAALLANGIRHMRAQEGIIYMRSLVPPDDPPTTRDDVVPLEAARERQTQRRHRDSRSEA